MPENGTPGLTRRGLETESRRALPGHERGNPGYRQEPAFRITAPVLDPTIRPVLIMPELDRRLSAP